MRAKQQIGILLISGIVLILTESTAQPAGPLGQCQVSPPSAAGAAGGGGEVRDRNPDCEDPDNDESRDPPDESGSDLKWDILIFNPSDPNDITGPEGYDTLRWVARSQTMPYLIRFENDPVFATAPAVRVVVTCPIDPNHDILQFRLGSYGFNGMLFEVPQNTATYSTRLDLTEELDIFVDITAGVNIVTREAFWIFQSIDPITGLPVTDVEKGFLPVKDTSFIENDTLGIGIPGDGFANFTIRPAPTTQTRDTVTAHASIVFDNEGEVLTNVEVHTIDAYPPVSHIAPLPDTSPISNPVLVIDINDDPDGCGVLNYDLYVSVNMAPYVLYAQGLTNTNFTFDGVPGVHYRFFTRARDNVYNLEAKSLADTETIISPLACRQGAPCTSDGFSGTYDENCNCVLDPGLLCPAAMTVCPSDAPFELTGAFPEGGEYSGNGVIDGYFYPQTAGKGLHTIMYEYTDPLDGLHQCAFEVTVRSGLVVNTDDDGTGTLREVIFCMTDGDTIVFHASLTGDTIFLSGEITADKHLTIDGLGVNQLFISGAGDTRIFHLPEGTVLTIKNLKLLDQGGAILVEGHLILENVVFENNLEDGAPKAFTVVPGATVEIRGVVEMRDE